MRCARLRLLEDWNPKDGAVLRKFFMFDNSNAIALEGRVTRVAIDHMGVAFAPAQEERIQALLDVISDHY